MSRKPGELHNQVLRNCLEASQLGEPFNFTSYGRSLVVSCQLRRLPDGSGCSAIRDSQQGQKPFLSLFFRHLPSPSDLGFRFFSRKLILK